uniref:Uncharacterized protein n=1 Tax=Tetranychus urticae TaxID=32264 RepID=T1KRE0_TETUR
MFHSSSCGLFAFFALQHSTRKQFLNQALKTIQLQLTPTTPAEPATSTTSTTSTGTAAGSTSPLPLPISS